MPAQQNPLHHQQRKYCNSKFQTLRRSAVLFVCFLFSQFVTAQNVLPDSTVRNLINVNRRYVNVDIAGPRDYETIIPLIESYDGIKDPKLKGDAAYVLGHYYVHLLDAENGLKYFSEAANLYKASGYWGLYLKVMKDFCNVNRLAGNFDIIETTLKECLNIAGKHNVGFYILNPMQELAIDLAYNEKKYDEAIKYGLMCLDTLKKYESQHIKNADFEYIRTVDAQIVNLELGHSYLKLGQYDNARIYLKKAEVFFLPRNDPDKLARIYRHLAILANHQKQPDLASDYLQKFDNYTSAYQKTQLKVLYSLPKLTREIYTLKQAYDKSQRELERLMVENYYIVGLSALALILALYGYWSQRKSKLNQEKVNEFLRREFEMSEKLNEEKTKYFSILSHELRTPIFAITGLARLMVTPGNDTRENIDAIINSGNHLLHLVNNVLQHNKLEESDHITLDEVDFELLQTIEEVMQTTSYLASQKDVTVVFHNDVDGPQYVNGDQQKLSQILVNLISNAIRYTHRNGHVDVLVSCVHIDEKIKKFHFSVKDDGVGIENEQLTALFDYKKTSYDEKSENPDNLKGMGIGLFVVSNFISAMGSEIFLNSEPRKGTNFYFDLTFKVTNPATPPKDVSFLLTTDANILVVDDIKINLIVTQKTLSSVGVRSITATDADPIIDILKKEHIDLILLDLNMPLISGYDLSKRIRQAGFTMPIIAHTAVIKENIDVDSLKEADIQDFLIKPYSMEELKEKLAQYLKVNV